TRIRRSPSGLVLARSHSRRATPCRSRRDALGRQGFLERLRRPKMATVRTKSFTYRIVPSVTDSGEPIYKLYRDWAIAIPLAGLVGGSVLLAQNKDRSVLERAIDHLEQKT